MPRRSKFTKLNAIPGAADGDIEHAVEDDDHEEEQDCEATKVNFPTLQSLPSVVGFDTKERKARLGRNKPRKRTTKEDEDPFEAAAAITPVHADEDDAELPPPQQQPPPSQ